MPLLLIDLAHEYNARLEICITVNNPDLGNRNNIP